MRGGLNPITYISEASPFAKTFREAIEDVTKKIAKKGISEHQKRMFYLLAHAKPLSGSVAVGTSAVEKQFYLENEWRYVPDYSKIPCFCTRKQHEDAKFLNFANKIARERCTLKFTPDDIRYIFVKADADIPGLVNFINDRLDKHPSAHLKILLSRITSLEWLSLDA